MKTILGLLLGAGCAAIIACSGAMSQKSAAPMPASQTMSPRTDTTTHDSIAQLDHAIESELAQLDIKRPASPPTACVTCAQPASVPVKPTATNTCHPGPSDKCKDSCRLADSICENAGKICELATQLGGDDAYANGKCDSGKASCEAAGPACCGCQL